MCYECIVPGEIPESTKYVGLFRGYVFDHVDMGFVSHNQWIHPKSFRIETVFLSGATI
jgi:hypothetical protein